MKQFLANLLLMNNYSYFFRTSVLALLLSSTGLPAAVIYDSLNYGSVSTGVRSDSWNGQTFFAGANSSTLTSVTLRMDNAFNASGNFFVRIYDATGDGSRPGSLLATLTGSASPSDAGFYSYSGSVELAASTTYYVVAGVSSGSGYYRWTGSSDFPPDIGSDIGFSDSADQGGTWDPRSEPHSFSMQVTAVPEPVNMGLGIFGLLLGVQQSFRWWKARRA